MYSVSCTLRPNIKPQVNDLTNPSCTLQETNQEVPGWLQGIASRAPQYGGKNRRGGGNRFGGRDFRRDAGAGGCKFSAWVYTCSLNLCCSLSVRSSGRGADLKGFLLPSLLHASAARLSGLKAVIQLWQGVSAAVLHGGQLVLQQHVGEACSVTPELLCMQL